ncbi:hypothetical protein AS850_02655 [Frondihabitans sp. 762G35]|uniref:hypothetical protein n=1 Tax=Frondihabitans sp. 762G35 TaxID=1446794 RepID=UPI000D210999|nr:hypothetical protein [Frondihabitans sp. 762G35]ARC55973.1 hypothetical protein AS850_02655 [Frondihabitans sp. 762G35]
MTITVYPVNALNGNPVYSGRSLRQTVAGIPFAGATAARPLGFTSGVRPGTPASTASATSTKWSCGPLAGGLDVQTAAEAGGYLFSSDALVSGDLVPASSSGPRTDIVYAQVSDQQEDGSGLTQVDIKYLAGVAQSGAPVPATPARSMRLFRINMPTSGGGAPTTTWDAPPLLAAGAMLFAADSNSYPLNPYPGQGVFNLAMGCPVYFNGTSWSDTGWVNVPALLNGFTISTVVGYRVLNGICYLRGGVGRPASFTTRATAFTLPVGARPTADLLLPVGVSGWGGDVQILAADGTVGFQSPTARSGTPAYQITGLSYPVS